MKKEEFLNELKQRLDILSDDEKQDIIEEYSQHIDLKIGTGLSEEAVAGDFGNIKELADEILSAYNVNLKYNKAKKGNNLKPSVGKGLKAILELWKAGKSNVTQLLKKCARGIIRCGKAAKKFCKSGVDKSKSLFTVIGFKLRHVIKKEGTVQGEKIEEAAQQLENEDHVSKEEGTQNEKVIGIKMEKERRKVTLHITIGNKVKKAAKSICHRVKWICHWFSLFCILCAAIPFIIYGAMGLLVLGFFLVLIPQGYPIVGISIISVGICLVIASILGILLSFGSQILSKKIYGPKIHVRKIMAIIVCAGIFITGIGTGISFLEYSSLEYGGKQMLYEGESITDVFTLDFNKDVIGEMLTINDHTYSASCKIEVLSDPNLSQNEIVFEITYQKGSGRPIIEKHKAEENVYIIKQENENAKSEFEIFMDYKSHFLKDIKNGMISEYIRENRWDCNIKVSPENRINVGNYY